MSILIALLVGAGLGVATGFMFKRNGDYMVIDLVVGVTGALLGMLLVFFTNTNSGFFSVSGILASTSGAALFLIIYQLLLRIPKHKNIEHH